MSTDAREAWLQTAEKLLSFVLSAHVTAITADEHSDLDAAVRTLKTHLRTTPEGYALVKVEPVAEIESWTNGSYHRNYKLRWFDNGLREGTKLYIVHKDAP